MASQYTPSAPTKTITSIACSPDGLTIVLGSKEGTVYRLNDIKTPIFLQLTSTGTAEITASAWSDDGRWVVTGDAKGDVRLWDASKKDNISLSRSLPSPNTSADRINRLIFVPDSTAVVILRGSRLFVWDIYQSKYLTGIGLSPSAKNIALDRANKRVAIAIGNDVFLYDMKASNDGPKKPDQDSSNSSSSNTNSGGPGSSTKDGPAPAELKNMDITGQVSKTQADAFVGLFYEIYHGVWEVDSPVHFEHAVAIKSLRTGFDPRSSVQARQAFESILYKELKTWRSLKSNNIVPLLGVTMASEFGKFPAIVTSWMLNGLLTEYLRSGKSFDRLALSIGVGDGVAYLHSNNIVHGDIRASSILIDERGNARLADLGLLKILEQSPLMTSGEGLGAAYRWMAPELLKEPPAKISSATDIFAFTMTCLEIHSGDIPFAGVREFQVASQILQSQRPPRPSNVKDAVWALWQEGWNQDATKRPGMVNYVKRLREAM